MKKCKTCGGDVAEFKLGKYKCSWCGHEFTEQDFLSEDKQSVSDLETFSLLNKARQAIELEYDFKKSLKYSQSVLEKNPENQEANWLAMIAENQIIYIQNDKAKYVPTFLDPENACIKKSKYYSALNSNYRADADVVEKVRLDTVEEFKKVKPYDVFISYKQHESDNPGAETKEAVWARDIYTELKTNQKTRSLNVFFDQKCLSGANVGWEPHIFSAIKSSKCMILLGSSLENINSRWVKNEWKRFIALKARGEKKDFIVLGSEAVNPILLDEKLQEKQMVSNTSGRWLNEILDRVIGICGKPVKEKPEEPPKPVRPKKKVNKKAVAAACICLGILVAGGGLGGGLYYKNSMDAVKDTVALINYLPDYEIQDYSQYEELIDEAYSKYVSLSGWQQGKVENVDKLTSALQGFNTYRVESIRNAIKGISVDTVAESDDLKTAVTAFEKLTPDQRAMLTNDEKAKLDNYVKVYSCITSIDGVKDDLMNKYGEVDGIKRTYLSIAKEYQALVYNYSLVETFTAQYEFYSNLTFTEVTGGYSIGLKEGGTLSGKLEIPEKYNGQNIVEIVEEGFKDCRDLTSVKVPDTVKTIGKGAFQGCTKITEMTLPFTGKSAEAENEEAVLGYVFGYETKVNNFGIDIGFANATENAVDGTVLQFAYRAGYNATTNYHYYIPASLKTVTITKQTEIPLAAFNGCNMLTSVKYEKTLVTIGNYALQNCGSLEKFNSENSGELNLRGFKGTVGNYAYSGCSSFDDIIILQVSQIGEYAFQNLRLLTKIEISANTKTIGLGAFKGCNKITEMTLPFVGNSEIAAESVQKGYEKVFGYIFGYETKVNNFGSDIGFANATENAVDGTVLQFAYRAGYNSTTNYHYYIPTSIRTVTVTKQTEVPLAAFNGCNMLTSITFNQTVLTVGDCAFQNCEELSTYNSKTAGTVNLEDTTGTIGAYAFANCYQISDIEISQVSQIGEYAFKNLSLLTDVVVENGTKTIGVGAFNGCKKLENITLPFVGNSEIEAESVQKGYEKVFGYIFGYETKVNNFGIDIGFANATENMVDGAVLQFAYRAGYNSTTNYHYYIPTSIRTVTITKQEEIPLAAFNGCNMLTSVTFNQTVLTVGDCAFQNCEELSTYNSKTAGTVNLEDTTGTIGAYAFANCYQISDIEISQASQIGEYAFKNLNLLTDVVVGNNTKTIGLGAFNGCKKLENITLPFVGNSEIAATSVQKGYEKVFGYIFGYETKVNNFGSDIGFANATNNTVDGTVLQFAYRAGYNSTTNYHYYIPTSLKTVTITKQTEVPLAAFNGCSNLTDVTYTNGITTRGNYAFQNCNAEIHEGEN